MPAKQPPSVGVLFLVEVWLIAIQFLHYIGPGSLLCVSGPEYHSLFLPITCLTLLEDINIPPQIVEDLVGLCRLRQHFEFAGLFPAEVGRADRHDA